MKHRTDEGSTDTPQGVGHGGGRVVTPPKHVPVLLKEAIDFLNVQRGGTYIDATVGLGGHSYEIAKRLGAPGHLIGLDKDPAALEVAREKLVVGRSSLVVGQELETFASVEPAADREADQANDQRPTTNDQIPDWPTITLLNRSFAEIAKGQRRRAWTGFWPTSGSAVCSSTMRHADLVFRRMDRSTCGWTRVASEPPNKW